MSTKKQSEPELVPVKNISPGPLALEGGGLLATEQEGKAMPCPHLDAQIQAGLLLDLTPTKDKE